MRLTPTQIDTIQSTVHAVLGEGAQVTLFGSRVDDSLKGGDIDDWVPFIDNLLDRLGLELGGIFGSFHLNGSSSVLTSLFVY